MKYTADFLVTRAIGDMFQSINGDVWQVREIHGMWRGMQRATVERVWKYQICSHCGSLKPLDQSCGCFDNDCQ